MADIKKLLESIDKLSERKATISKPNNPVAKNAMATVGGGGYGKHKDKKKDEKVGKEKHKRSFMKDLAETAAETKELRKIKESWKQFQTEANELKEYGAQSTDPNAQTTNPAQQGGVTAPQQNKATQEYNQIQKNSPQQTGTQIDTTDDPDTFINFMKDPQFINALKTNKSFADQLKKVFNSAGFK